MGICRLPMQIVVPSSGPPKGKTLDEYTWEEISYISSNGLAGEYGFQVGGAKAITLNGTVGDLTLDNYQTYAFIIGINHNAELEGNNLIHFQIGKTALTNGVDIAFIDSEYDDNGNTAGFRINLSNTNVGGWKESYMRNSICGTSLTSYSGTFIGAIPDDLRLALKPVIKYTDNVGGASGNVAANITATTDYFFLPSQYEMSGEINLSNSYEANFQQQYDYYKTLTSKIKYAHNDTSAAVKTWCRSLYYGFQSWVYIKATDGSENINASGSSFGVPPCFCV